MFAVRFVEALRPLRAALGALLLVTGVAACGAGEAEPDAAEEPTAAACSLAIRLAGGGLVFDSSGSDTKACASGASSGPGMDLTFVPLDRSVVSAVKISARRVDAGKLASAVPAIVSVEHVDGRTSHPIACQVTVVENTALKGDAKGDRYLVRGTGACASPDPLTGVGVDGTFSFASSARWTTP